MNLGLLEKMPPSPLGEDTPLLPAGADELRIRLPNPMHGKPAPIGLTPPCLGPSKSSPPSQWRTMKSRRRGARLLITGPNGAGKSYFLRQLVAEMRRKHPEGVHLHIGPSWIVEPFYVAPLTRDQLPEYVFGGQDPFGRPVHGLSRGNQMLVLLAEMLESVNKYYLDRPVLLTFDETFGSLDAARAAEVGQLLQEASKGQVNMAIISHDPRMIAQYGDPSSGWDVLHIVDQKVLCAGSECSNSEIPSIIEFAGSTSTVPQLHHAIAVDVRSTQKPSLLHRKLHLLLVLACEPLRYLVTYITILAMDNGNDCHSKARNNKSLCVFMIFFFQMSNQPLIPFMYRNKISWRQKVSRTGTVFQPSNILVVAELMCACLLLAVVYLLVFQYCWDPGCWEPISLFPAYWYMASIGFILTPIMGWFSLALMVLEIFLVFTFNGEAPLLTSSSVEALSWVSVTTASLNSGHAAQAYVIATVGFVACCLVGFWDVTRGEMLGGS